MSQTLPRSYTLADQAKLQAIMNGTDPTMVSLKTRKSVAKGYKPPPFPRNYHSPDALMRTARRAFRWLKANPEAWPKDAPAHIREAIVVAQAFSK